VFVTIVLIVYAFFLYRLWNRCAKLKNSLHEIQNKNENPTNTNFQVKNGNTNQTPTKITLGEKEIDIIVDVVMPRLLKCIELEQKDVQNGISQQSSHLYEKYLKEKNGEFLSHETSNADEGKFKLLNIQGNKAKFEFSGKVADFVSPDYFDKACEFSNNPKNVNPIRHIKTIEKGEVESQPDGIWKVTKKAKIKFE